MSKRVQLLFAVVLILAVAFETRGAEWHKIKIASNETFTGLHFIDETKGFLVTNKQNILTLNETDSGWTVSSLSIGVSLDNICFTPDGKAGFAFGSQGIIFKTDDSGRTWSSDTLNSDTRFRNMAFFDSQKGILIGEVHTRDKGTSGVAYRTDDGGRTWRQFDIEGWRFSCLYTSPEGTAIIIGTRRVFVSHDFGITWTMTLLPAKIVPNAAAIRGNNGIIVGMSGFLSLSDDRGASWHEKEIITWKINLSALLMLDSLRAYAAGSFGEILFTDDGGWNWIPEPSGTGENLTGIHVAGNRLVACGRNGAIVYADLKNERE
ncbi:MAG: hypothetical protein JSU69_05775 [Candidatus Zixiibacteriota bacterium]|nr:MAG: hypothetical protein JSU69_05775 [candidate division Zixibacteria bacterium]